MALSIRWLNERKGKFPRGIIGSKGGFGVFLAKIVHYFGFVSPASTMPWRDWLSRSKKSLCTAIINALKDITGNVILRIKFRKNINTCKFAQKHSLLTKLDFGNQEV